MISDHLASDGVTGQMQMKLDFNIFRNSVLLEGPVGQYSALALLALQASRSETNLHCLLIVVNSM
jgi:hypothetical protein